MLIHLLFAATAAGQAVPQTVPIYCLDKAATFQPVVRTDYARLQAAFRRQYNFDAKLTQSSSTGGTLVFRGGVRGAETITYEVMPYTGDSGAGIGLMTMRVRLKGVTQDLYGDEMCWQTFGIVNGE